MKSLSPTPMLLRSRNPISPPDHRGLEFQCDSTSNQAPCMKRKNLIQLLLLACLLFFRSTAPAQTANWLGSVDTDWNTAGNWDIGVPAEGTNAVIAPGAIVNYTTPMTATSFASVTNSGTLTINAAGFNVDG